MTSSVASVHHTRTYRPFIDGLRAIAIIAVVGSHINLPGFGGGYVGVDIFFVISGYLIINQIIEDIKNNEFNIFEFWSRRAFRILPAFLLVMVVCLALTTTVFVRPGNKEFAESFFLSAIMLANHHFLAHQGYFETNAFAKPLLHMWTLAVEEQFYLVAPAILFSVTVATATMTLKSSQRTWTAVTLALGLVSFAACVAFTYPSGRPNVSFYIMPARGWEFVFGGIAPSLASTFRRFPPWVSECFATVGIVFIVLAILLFDSNTIYPSYRAALPALGAMLIIIGGLVKPRNMVACVLATRPLVRIGLFSYAWYLWHWPLISFVATTDFGGRNIVLEISAAILSLALAALTFYFVELPARHYRQTHRFSAIKVVATGTLSCVAVASVGYFWSLRFAPLMLPELTGLDPPQIIEHNYPAILHQGVLLGDSEATVIYPQFQEYAGKIGSDLTITARAGCPPLLKIAVKGTAGTIASYCEPFFHSISFQGAEFAIIIARWNLYLGLPQSDPFYRSSVLVDAQAMNDPKDPYEVFATGLAATISEAQRAGVQRILIVGPLPEFPRSAPYCVMRSIRARVDLCSIPRTEVDARREHTMTILRQAAASSSTIRLINPIDLFCTPTECRPNNGTRLFFSDTTHLSSAGTERLFRRYEGEFLWALTGDRAGLIFNIAHSSGYLGLIVR
jgi:peptidoglycan/LPS O-acetylase OafA/YrhL